MKHHLRITDRGAPVLVRWLRRAAPVIVALSVLGVPGTSQANAPKITAEQPDAGAAESLAIDASDRDKLADRWGIEISSVRLTAHNHMIDYRYKVLDAEKAGDLFKRQIKPYLIHEKSGKVLAVPETAKLGPLRNSNIPKQDRIYWMFFGNANHLVQKGDQATVVIGDFRVENLVVE